MSRYYTKNAYSPVNRTQYIGAQKGEPKVSLETNQTPQEPNYGVHEQNSRKCHVCGIVLKDTRHYIIDWIGHGFQAVCLKCYAK